MISTKTLTALGTIAALTVLPACLDQNKAIAEVSQEPNSGQGITGTWRVLASPAPNPEAGAIPPFFTYTTFNREGTLIESSSDPLQGSRPGHGVWKKTGKGKFKAIFEQFIEFNPIIQQPGVFVFRVTEVIKLTGEDSYQGLSQVSICNNAGQECQPLGTTPTEGSRLKID